MSGEIFPLSDTQQQAVEPRDSVWLSASAGTGKTQVLSARVLRLLLESGTQPSELLCLTFTKAGAAEMATRVNEVLARWVRMSDTDLASDLRKIGAPHGRETLERARTLFASVLDCPGGGLRIDTIHAFAQWLLSAFPEEAGLLPGTRAMEDRDRDLLAHDVLAALLVDLQRDGEKALLDTLAELSVTHGPDGARSWLMRCADAREMWFGTGAWQGPLEERVKQLLGLPSDADEAWLSTYCLSPEFDQPALEQCLAHYGDWKSSSSKTALDVIPRWLAQDAANRLAMLPALSEALFYKNGNGKLPKTCDPAFAEASERVKNSLVRVMGLQMTLDFAARLAPALALGRRFALEWDDAKKREGFIDFNDQIREAAKLLSDQSVSAWIRYKLDRQFDHVLVDEAQDTNADQWSIIKALTDDYWDGEGQHGEKLRTLFVVGDYKQAIFGFQGTSPENFRLAREFFAAKIKAAAENAARLRSNLVPRELQELDLGQSYRTAQVVLEFVNRALAAIGHAAIGLDRAPADHAGDKRPGLVTLWQPVKAGVGDDGSDGEEVDTPKWLSPPERLMADKIAMQVRSWLDKGFPLHKKKGAPRNAGPGDIMVLVRSRKELAGLIVARLHAAGVPVAGVDRLRLGAPLAVKDLMAALRFAAQPLDDLSLASLLVSPLGGWSQDALLEHGYREKGVSLWRHLRDSREPMVVETVARLRDLLNLADFETPQALLHWILVGPWRGRQKLVARLGSEANDPIDELLNAAHAYASAHTASLQGFIRWFDAGDGELKRENDGAGGLVRVMTVHGSKGLQAPIVILADAVANPDNKQAGSLDLVEEVAGEMGRKVPMLPERKDDLPAPLQSVAEANKAAEMQEHWRLLYVAMTRAEEALYVGGALGSREEEPAANSWFARLVQLFDGEPVQDPIWETAHEWGGLGERVPLTTASAVADPLGPLPDWAANPVGPEPKPPRPLAPSSVGEEQGADPPLPPDVAREAARRGVLLHRLLERLPVIAPDDREEQARNWLTRQAGELDETLREDMLRSALAVLDEPGFAEIFGPDGLAEVPLAAVVEGQVVAGRVDRLLVTDSEVTLVDFKTSRRPPAALKQVPEATLRQMGAYAAALAQIYPGRVIRAALLYTQAPRLIELPAEVLAQRKPGLSTRQESFAELRLV